MPKSQEGSGLSPLTASRRPAPSLATYVQIDGNAASSLSAERPS